MILLVLVFLLAMSLATIAIVLLLVALFFQMRSLCNFIAALWRYGRRR